jgi:hypothetical protein
MDSGEEIRASESGVGTKRKNAKPEQAQRDSQWPLLPARRAIKAEQQQTLAPESI